VGSSKSNTVDPSSVSALAPAAGRLSPDVRNAPASFCPDERGVFQKGAFDWRSAVHPLTRCGVSWLLDSWPAGGCCSSGYGVGRGGCVEARHDAHARWFLLCLRFCRDSPRMYYRFYLVARSRLSPVHGRRHRIVRHTILAAIRCALDPGATVDSAVAVGSCSILSRKMRPFFFRRARLGFVFAFALMKSVSCSTGL